MTLWAILSDVHGNREALDACLRDAEGQGADKIAILGDVVDYGPDPVYCIERSTEVADVLLVGNHEQATVETDEYAEPSAVMDWSLGVLSESAVWRELQEQIREQGAVELASRVVGDMHFVHASAGRPTIQYVWPGHEIQYVQFNHHIDDRLSKFLGEFQATLGFNGHTHVPAVMTGYEHREIFDAYKGVRRHHVHT
ncbi:MAG: metallophosphoesterase family protein, partial [Deltaproteobacteria bacterium]|nr:metallophosphoesterase family protein [Deltaproteobacteria bacterium]